MTLMMMMMMVVVVVVVVVVVGVVMIWYEATCQYKYAMIIKRVNRP